MTIDVPLAESKTFDFYEAWRWAGHWKSEAIFRGLHPSSQLGSAGGTPRKNDTTDKSNGKKRRPDVVGAEDASLCESRQQNPPASNKPGLWQDVSFRVKDEFP